MEKYIKMVLMLKLDHNYLEKQNLFAYILLHSEMFLVFL